MAPLVVKNGVNHCAISYFPGPQMEGGAVSLGVSRSEKRLYRSRYMIPGDAVISESYLPNPKIRVSQFQRYKFAELF